MSNSVSPQAKLVQDLGQGFHNKDLDAIAKTLHKDFRYVTYPRSLNLQDKTKEEFLEYLKGIVPLWTEVKETNHSITEAPGKVIVHFTSLTKSSIGVDTTHEAITIAHIVTDDDGSLKIKKTEEFVDSKTYLETMRAYGAAKAK